MLGGRFLCACWASNCWLESEPPTHSLTHAHNFVSRDVYMYSQPNVGWHAYAMYTQTIMHACSMVEQVRPHGTRWVSWRLNAAVLRSVGGRSNTHTSGSNNVLRKCCSCWRCCVRPNNDRVKTGDSRSAVCYTHHKRHRHSPLSTAAPSSRAQASCAPQTRATTEGKLVAGTSETRFKLERAWPSFGRSLRILISKAKGSHAQNNGAFI
jgi:hypothetical protein